MYVCENCFDSDVINEHIIKVGRKFRADFICKECENRSRYRVDRNILADDVRSAITRHFSNDGQHGLYASASTMAKEEDDDFSDILSTYNLIGISYDLFKIDYNEKFYKLILDDPGYDSLFTGSEYDEGWMNIGRDWDGSSFIELEWEDFCENVMHKARFFDHAQFDRKKELSKLDETFYTLSKRITKTLYRARKANEDDKLLLIESNPKEELGIARPHKAGHNRFSPSGIPYVYLSEDDKTIIKEIRANVGDRVGIAKFQIDNLNLVDLRKNTLDLISKDLFNEKCTAQLKCSANTISDFLIDITKPINKEDNHLEYIPTQIVSEYIWSLGYDGFIFDSSLCSGTNYVLFRPTYSYVDYEIKKVKFNKMRIDSIFYKILSHLMFLARRFYNLR